TSYTRKSSYVYAPARKWGRKFLHVSRWNCSTFPARSSRRRANMSTCANGAELHQTTLPLARRLDPHLEFLEPVDHGACPQVHPGHVRVDLIRLQLLGVFLRGGVPIGDGDVRVLTGDLFVVLVRFLHE